MPQGRAGRGVDGLVGVRVRVGGAPVTLAVQPRAAAALPPVPVTGRPRRPGRYAGVSETYTCLRSLTRL